jgi:accessory gene regulator B
MLYKTISDLIINRLSSKTDIEMEYRDIYSYALEKYISGLINTIIFAAVALFLRIPLETAVFFIFYAPLRKYAGGIHARTRLQCTVYSLVILAVLIKAAKLISMTEYWFLTVAAGVVFAIVSVFSFAPVDSEKRRLSGATRRHYRSLSRRIVLSEGILILLGMGLLPSKKQYILTAVMALLFSGILIVPYKKNMEGKEYEKKVNEQPVD